MCFKCGDVMEYLVGKVGFKRTNFVFVVVFVFVALFICFCSSVHLLKWVIVHLKCKLKRSGRGLIKKKCYCSCILFLKKK